MQQDWAQLWGQGLDGLPIFAAQSCGVAVCKSQDFCEFHEACEQVVGVFVGPRSKVVKLLLPGLGVLWKAELELFQDSCHWIRDVCECGIG